MKTKTYVVTGATSGIGKALVEILAKEKTAHLDGRKTSIVFISRIIRQSSLKLAICENMHGKKYVS